MYLETLLLLSSAVLCITAVLDTSRCPCEDPSSRAIWATDDSEFCFGCDREVQRRCLLPNGNVMNCRVTLTCPVSACTGNWAPWANDGPCDNPCGSGHQKQVRICYQGGDNGNIRGRLCEGGYGRRQKLRYNECNSRRKCGVTTKPTTTTTTVTTKPPTTSFIIGPTTAFIIGPTTALTTLKQETVTTTSNVDIPSSSTTLKMITSSIKQDNNRTLSTTIKTTTSISPPLDIPRAPIELPLVLGSVAIICIAIIIIFVIIIRRRSNNNKLVSSETYETNCSNGNNEKGIDAHLYEEVGPVPPRRNINMNTDKSMTHNVIYNPEVEYEEAYQESGDAKAAQTHIAMKEPIYVDPVGPLNHDSKPSSFSNTINEDISSYVTLDQVHQGNH